MTNKEPTEHLQEHPLDAEVFIHMADSEGLAPVTGLVRAPEARAPRSRRGGD